MSGLRRQSAELPLPASNLTLAARAHAAGHADEGDRLFHAAFLDVLPLVRAIVHKHLAGPEDREDAIQQAMVNIWRAVRKGIDPAIEMRARGASIDRYRREQRHASRRAGDVATDRHTAGSPIAGTGSVGGRNTPADENDDWFVVEHAIEADHVDDTIDAIEVERIAGVLGEHRALWADITRCLASGLTQAETARHLQRPPGTIGRNVTEIRTFVERRKAS